MKRIKYNDVETINKITFAIQDFYHRLDEENISTHYIDELSTPCKMVLCLDNDGISTEEISMGNVEVGASVADLCIVVENIMAGRTYIKSLAPNCKKIKIDIEKLLMTKMISLLSLDAREEETAIPDINACIEKAKDLFSVLNEIKDYEFYIVSNDSILV